MGVPTYYTRLLQHPDFVREAVGGMRVFISGSAPLLAETHKQFHDRTGHAILERYGMTETSMNTSNPLHGERRAGTVGFPLPGVDVRITGLGDGSVLQAGEPGMIELRGPNLFQGYWRNPEKTAEDMTGDGYFRTGDIGRFDADGYLHITGRAKDLIISGGFNVYPKEVEDLINAVPGVAESAVIGLPHPDFGEGVTAVVVLEPGHSADNSNIAAVLGGQLAKYKQPKQIVFADALPRNAMGKVQKSALRDLHRNLYRPV
jgi:malonyl-CoA/methylmalonyl-CoA synthetase